MKKIIFITLFLLAASISVDAQVYKYRWVATVNANGANVIGGMLQNDVFYLCFSGNSFYVSDANGNRHRDAGFGYCNTWASGGNGFGSPINPLNWHYKSTDSRGCKIYTSNRSLINNYGQIVDYNHDIARFSSDMKRVNIEIDTRFVSGAYSSLPFTVFSVPNGTVVVLEMVEDALGGDMY